MRKIAVLLLVGVIFLMGGVVLAQDLPGVLPGLEPAVEQVAIPDYGQWEIQQKIGLDITGNGALDIIMAKYAKQELGEAVVPETGQKVQVGIKLDVIKIYEFSPEEAFMIWQHSEMGMKQPEVHFAVLEGGQWKMVSNQVFSESLLALVQIKGINPQYFIYPQALIQGLMERIQWIVL